MHHKFNILIPDRLKPPADIEAQIFCDGTEIILKQATHSNEIEDKIWEECDAVLAWHEIQYDKELLKKMKNCKVIVRVGVGYDNVDINAAYKLGIKVCNVPDYGTNDVADHTIALMLTLGRGIEIYHKAAKEGDWRWEVAGDLRRINGLNIGIIGLGRIGTAVSLRAKEFGLNVYFYDPYKPDGYEKSLGISRVNDLFNIANVSDIISIHAPLTEETNRMIEAEFFKRCRTGMMLINTARGPIVDLNELYKSMKKNKVHSAGLDVLPIEPANLDNPLIFAWKNDEDWLKGRLVITPHCAFFNKQSYSEMRRKAAEEAKRVLLGQSPRNLILPDSSIQLGVCE